MKFEKCGRLLILSACLYVAFSCNKREAFPVQSTYTFINHTEAIVNIDIYNSKYDYGLNTNRLAQYRIMPNASQAMILEVGKTYWLDWYNDNFQWNNWAIADENTSFLDPAPRPPITVAAADDSYVLQSRRRDTTRSVLLPGMSSESTWEVLLANSAGYSGRHRFAFRKDFSCRYTFLHANDSLFRELSYRITRASGDGLFRLEVSDSSGVANELYYNASPSSYPNFGRDTLMISFRKLSYYDYHAAVRR